MGYDLHTALHQYTLDPAVDPEGISAAAVTSRVRRLRAGRAATTGVAAVAVVAVSAYGLISLRTHDATPGLPASPWPTASSTPRPTPEPTPTAKPSTAPVPGGSPTGVTGQPEAPATPVFRAGGRVADFPAHAPERDVSDYLTARLGVEPVVQEPFACPPSGLPGVTLGWPGTGVGLRVRTTDDEGRTVDPYVAAWTLMEPSAALGLATDAGLTAGTPKGRVLDAYPNARYGEDEGMGWWYAVGEYPEDLLVVGRTDSVYRIESGYGCGE